MSIGLCREVIEIIMVMKSLKLLVYGRNLPHAFFMDHTNHTIQLFLCSSSTSELKSAFGYEAFFRVDVHCAYVLHVLFQRSESACEQIENESALTRK